MKLLIGLSLLAIISTSSSECNKTNKGTRYEGRLEIKGICMNYTISLLSGDMDSSKLEQSWTDENTKKNYSKVFALGNPCQFPKTINQGDRFFFTIDTTEQEPCAVCEAYYPTPGKKLNIKVETK